MSLRTQLHTSLEVLVKTRAIFREYVLELYFPAQGLSRSQRWRCAPMLFMVEYLVYRVDTIAEDTKATDLDAAGNRNYDQLVRYKIKFESLLRRLGAHNEAVARQLDMGEQYVRLENKVTTHGVVAHEQVLQLAELRASDVRLLHGMTFALLGIPIDNALLDLLWPVEVLADIGNDLDHYTADVAAGQYNTYDALVRLYDRAAPAQLRVEIARYEDMFHAELTKFPPGRRADLAALCVRRYRPRIGQIPAPQLRDAPDSPTTPEGLT